ncbi:MAG: hypothetical protein COT88_01610 [Candidatus Colwellbacteria bacterium CG10_big_fil_rev_8_21_14_0_10_41_28]|uniref:Multidrug ABC transporter substrate-binding protein n=1 Tax=Candidatus Colwellbacteria bacterium CG10_big_fil_rev_8_21_14_0_10_41_28 TaxID=1974539 RepID=A0A2H0VHE6_9BACT|nr:MAG: hypothetical protein COT88_01610 [Candidatus Colwellbacteria bacterium CG10_big_fil_rev_8_21_14_0_10_41_28]
MSIKHIARTSYRALWVNKSRSFLTVLGVLIGIASIIMMMSIGKGAENLILGEIGGLGAETVVVRPGQEPTGPTDVAETLLGDSLKDRDVDLLRKKSNVPDVIEVSPFVIVPGSVSYGGDTYRPMVIGGAADFFIDSFDAYPEEGVLFDESDTRQKANVAVIGSKVKEELFGDKSPIGESIRIKNQSFKVVGSLAPRGQVAFFDIDDLVIVPHTTAMTYILGIDYYHEIILTAKSADMVEYVIEDVTRTLREAHGITDPDKDDFFAVSQQGLADQIQIIIGSLTAFLSSVVAIALVVGGVGVMNIMLVSITERTREIGLRKAVGATKKNIMNQFLFEAVLLTSIGGVIGIILGGTLAFLISLVLAQTVAPAWTFTFPISAVFLGLGVTSLVGLVFGLYPAKKAAEKDPIEALRYE